MKSDQFTVRIGTWNTQWATLRSTRGMIVKDKLSAPECDVLCVTEGSAGILPNGGHVIDAGPDWGYPIRKGRRKVLLWSKLPWTPPPFAAGSEELPSGRFVAGVTETRSGAFLTVVGVCIPWFGAHVKGGRKDRKPWQDHAAWLSGFENLRCQLPGSRTVVLGDFNQQIPRRRAPRRVHGALMRAFEGLNIATRGELLGAPTLAIDHIAHTPDLDPRSMEYWHKKDNGGIHLSDHFGVWGDFSVT